MDRLSGTRALITGASRGLGRAIAEAYAEEGARVALAARSTDRLDELEREIGSDRALAVECDVTDTGAVEAAVERTVGAFGGLDAVVNNAGILARVDLAAATDEQIDSVVEVNLKGVMRVARATVPHLRRSEGSMINMSSVAAQRGPRDLSTYAATKGGVSSLTRQLAVQYAPEVRVNAIEPGTVETPMNEAAREDPEWARERAEAVPLGRLGQPEDVTGPAVFLASDEAAYITGHSLVVDGGGLVT